MYICMNIHMYIVALIHLKPVVSAHKAKRIAKRAFFPPLQQTTPMPYANPIDPEPPSSQPTSPSLSVEEESINFYVALGRHFCQFRFAVCSVPLFLSLPPPQPSLHKLSLNANRSQCLTHAHKEGVLVCVGSMIPPLFPLFCPSRRAKRRWRRSRRCCPAATTKCRTLEIMLLFWIVSFIIAPSVSDAFVAVAAAFRIVVFSINVVAIAILLRSRYCCCYK